MMRSLVIPSLMVARWWQNNAEAATILRIGSRPSPLALIQAEAVAQALVMADHANNMGTPKIIPISTSGDIKQNGVVQDVPLAMRSVDFTGALDDALQRGDIDVAVHSLKDIPPNHRWKNSQDFVIACPLPREDPADALLGPYQSLEEIPRFSKIGTSSVRRQAQLLALCGGKDNVEVVNIRGNLEARCQALANGQVDAIILAQAGLKRLESSSQAMPVSYTRIPVETMLPGLCQGIVAAVYKQDNPFQFHDWMPQNNDVYVAAMAERAFLDSLDKSSPWEGRPPLAGLMERRPCSGKQPQDDDSAWEWTFRGLLAKPDGSKVLRESHTVMGPMSKEEAEKIGAKVGSELLLQAGSGFFDD